MNKSDLPENVHLFEKDGREIYLVGTAHVSAKSAELVETVVRGVEPDSVAVELCAPRYRALKNPEEWKKTDIVQVVKQGKAFLLLAQLLLSGFQRKIGKKLGVQPGLEMLKAIEVAEELGAETVLADREVSITLKRTWGNLGFWGGLKLLLSLISESFAETQELDEDEIERLKTADVLEEAMQEFAQALPTVRESLIDERDKYLASKIHSAPGQKIVAIVGAGHVPGITKYLYETIELAPLETVPPPSPWRKIIGWGLPLLILTLIIYGATSSSNLVETRVEPYSQVVRLEHVPDEVKMVLVSAFDSQGVAKGVFRAKAPVEADKLIKVELAEAGPPNAELDLANASPAAENGTGGGEIEIQLQSPPPGTTSLRIDFFSGEPRVSGTQVGKEMLLDWLWVNAIFGALGSLMALAHPLTILVSFLVSPFTSANPAIAAGWVAGLLEASLRKPRVEDFEMLTSETLTLKVIYKNRVTRVLLVVILTNLMGGLGTFLAGGFIASRLA